MSMLLSSLQRSSSMVWLAGLTIELSKTLMVKKAMPSALQGRVRLEISSSQSMVSCSQLFSESTVTMVFTARSSVGALRHSSGDTSDPLNA